MNKLTVKQVVEFTKTMKERANVLAHLRAIGRSAPYPESDYGADFTEEGIVLHGQEREPYEDGYYTTDILVAWHDIEDATYQKAVNAAKREAEAYKRQQAEQAADWERSQFERLKAKFEPKS